MAYPTNLDGLLANYTDGMDAGDETPGSTNVGLLSGFMRQANTSINALQAELGTRGRRTFDLFLYQAAGDGSTPDTAAINNALAAAGAAGGGVVVGEIGRTYATLGGHAIPKNVWVANATFKHTGNNSCFTYDGQGAVTAWSDDDNPRTGVDRVRIIGNSGAAAAGLEVRNVEHYVIRDSLIGGSGGVGYTAGVGILFNNSKFWVESVDMTNVTVSGCLRCLGYLATAHVASMEYHRYRHVSLSPYSTSGIGMDVGMLGVANPNIGTFTVTIASPGVFTKTAHGFQAGALVRFSTTGALPTGLTAGTNYYVIAAGLTANTFQVSTTAGGAAVNTSGTQSGTHSISNLVPVGFGPANGNLDVNVWFGANTQVGVNVAPNAAIDETTQLHLHGESFSNTGCKYVANQGTFRPRGLIQFPFSGTEATADLTGATSTDLTGGVTRSHDDLRLKEMGLVAESFNVAHASSNLVAVTGTVYMQLVGLKGGDVISKVIVFINASTLPAGITLARVALYKRDGTMLASSASNHAAFNGVNNTFVTTNLTTPYIVPQSAPGGYYLAFVQVGATTALNLGSAPSGGAAVVSAVMNTGGAAMSSQYARTFTVTTGTPGTINRTAHGFVANNIVQFATTGTMPSGLSPFTNYFVLATGLTANAFQVSTTSGGAAVAITTTGTGVQTIPNADLLSPTGFSGGATAPIYMACAA